MGLFDRFRKKKPAAVPRNVTRHCFVLSALDGPADLSQASRIVARVFGRGYETEVDEEKAIVTVSKGNEAVGFLAHMPVPIPEGEAERNADQNFFWPDGAQECGEHKSHVICALAAEEEPIQAALAVSRLALVGLELFDGIGVYWGNASVCNSRRFFEESCEGMCAEDIPLPVWLRFQLVSGKDGRLGMYTLGMDQFGLMELEVDSSPMHVEELYEFVYNIAHYLVQSGPVIEDGNTVGASEEERILVRHLPSMIEEERTVYKIVFEA